MHVNEIRAECAGFRGGCLRASSQELYFPFSVFKSRLVPVLIQLLDLPF